MLTIEFAGQALMLLSERGIYWPAESALLVADVHLGKAGSFRARGMALPAGTSAHDLARLTQLVRQHRAQRLIVLGDLMHGRPDAALERQVAEWRRTLTVDELILVRGNHDRHLPQASHWQLSEHTEQQRAGIRLVHEPHGMPIGQIPQTPWTPPRTPEIGGHLHPTWRLQAGKSDSLRAPIFWQRPNQLVLPAFGSLTGGWDVPANEQDDIYLIGPDEVVLL